VVEGSIASLGSQYVLGLKAVNCRTGESLAGVQITSVGKEQVLKALGEATAKLRSTLGESLSTVHKFDTPIEQATTPSLEALQAYSLGFEAWVGKGDFVAAAPFFQRAVSLDPNFAMAYQDLGSCYELRGEDTLAKENVRKAYELRDRVSQLENFSIESMYHWFVTGDLEKARQVFELWAQTYPRHGALRGKGSGIYVELGQYGRALEEMRKGDQLNPTLGIVYAVLVNLDVLMNRLEEACATAGEAQAKNLDSPALHFGLYKLAFLQNDGPAMAQQVAWLAANGGCPLSQ
jgi:tetratricopeptide (TPR) repeat protein